MVTARTRWVAAGSVAAGLAIGSLLAGCGSREEGPPESVAAAKLAVPGNPPAAATPDGASGNQAAAPRNELQGRLPNSFKDAIVEGPPEDQWLPEVTKTGKSIGKLYEAVVAEWDKAALTTPDGKKLGYTATVTTDLGVITIELWPEIAPNHVRNFVALARAGYYDGLAFDRVIKRPEENGSLYESVEAGCPVGSGEANYGSIGYWLKPEFNAKVTHEPGTIGACHGEDVESAACKFYINLSKAEWLDGDFTLFGKVTQGLDVVRAIHDRPVRDDALGDRPVEPVMMRSVAISSAVKD